MKVLVINGPNMNMIDKRDAAVFGRGDYSELATYLWKEFGAMDITGIFFQSNHEGAIIDRIHQAMEGCDGIIINADSYAFTSLAIRDAIAAVNIPTVQVMFFDKHPAAPEKCSFLNDVCVKTIANKGARAYIEAAEYLKSLKTE